MRYYLQHGNGSRACRQMGLAGYEANRQARHFLSSKTVQAELARRRTLLDAQAMAGAHDVIRILSNCLLADATKVAQVVHLKCRDCWRGWDGEPESQPLNPDPECYYCDGKGQTTVELTESADLPAVERCAIQSVSEGREGIKVKLADKVSAARELAKILGLYNDSTADKKEPVPIYFDGIKFA
jgi:hypothetical protein